MGLKYVHLAFISMAGLVTGAFGVWALSRGTTMNVTLGVVSLAGTAALAVYGRAFARKMRALAVAAVIVLLPNPAFACPICFGQNDSPLTSGVVLGVSVLLGITGGLLAAFGAFFIQLRRRMQAVEQTTVAKHQQLPAES